MKAIYLMIRTRTAEYHVLARIAIWILLAWILGCSAVLIMVQINQMLAQ